ncbi:MAG: glycosyltransferase 87 family protein [Bryobacteraceae bacterium]|nr:glycosyltransferase 87 family protein [Bryobacteraceae bacterium]
MRAFHALGLVSLLAWIALAIRSHEPTNVPLAFFLTVMGVAWCATLWAWRLAPQLPRAPLLRGVWIWALMFRAAGLWGDPVLEDDHYRYLWDGWTYATTGDPYASSPADYFGDPAVPPAFEDILDRVNHPDVPTVYGPLTEAAFLLGYRIAPGRLWPWKLLVTAADILTALLLMRRLAPANLLLYAWCPLLIKETAFTAHPDSLGILFLVAALSLVAARPGLAGVCAALAAGVKLTGALLIPWILWRGGWRAAVGFAATAAALATGFGFGGLGTLAGDWEFNSSVFAMVSWLAGGLAARIACAILFCLFYVWLLLREREGLDIRGEWAYGGLFALSPVVNPWYLLWILPFVAGRPVGWALAALIAPALSYVCGLHLGDTTLGPYDHPPWLRWLEYGSVVWPILWAILMRREPTADRGSKRHDTVVRLHNQEI